MAPGYLEDRAVADENWLLLNKPRVWVLGRHLDNLLARLKGPPDGKPAQVREEAGLGNRHLHMSFAELQRMRLRELQCKLVISMIYMRKNREAPLAWEDDLKEYIQAVRDYDFMTDCSQRHNDPFDVSAMRLMDDEVMQRVASALKLWDGINYDDLHVVSPKLSPGSKEWESEPFPLGGTRSANLRMTWYTAFLMRLSFAFFGAAFLLAPMWIMVQSNTRNTCLFTTTGFVIVFGLIMAWRVDKPSDVLVATLAYAAVLVVFVGLAVEGEGRVEASVTEG